MEPVSANSLRRFFVFAPNAAGKVATAPVLRFAPVVAPRQAGSAWQRHACPAPPAVAGRPLFVERIAALDPILTLEDHIHLGACNAGQFGGPLRQGLGDEAFEHVRS